MNAARLRRLGSYALVAALLLAAVPLAAYAQESALVLDDFMGMSRWSQSSWADADVDPDNIVRYVPRIRNGIGIDGEPALQATLHFKPGGYSQGVVLQSNPGDWAEYDELVVELKLVQDVEDYTVRAKPIIFPDDRWTEAADKYGVALVPGEWVTLRVPLRAGDIWSAETTDEHLARIKAWAVKLWSTEIPATSEPVQVIIARPRLEKAAGNAAADPAPGVTVSSSFRVSPGAAGVDGVEVAGLAPAASGPRLSLTLTLKPGFVGPTPSLRLESRPDNLFPAYINATAARDAEGTYYYYELWKANLFAPGVYEAVLSVDPGSGLTTVAFGPVGGERLVEGHLYLDKEKGSEFWASGVAAGLPGRDLGTLQGFALPTPVEGITLEAISVSPQVIRRGRPFGLSDRVSMRVAAVGDAEPLNWVARQEVRTAGVDDPLRVVLRGLETPIPGELLIWLEGEEAGAGASARAGEQERSELWRGPFAAVASGEVILPAGSVPAGRQRLGVAYVDGSYHLDLAEAEIEMMRAFLMVSAAITRVEPDFQAEVRFAANAPLDGLDVTIKDERGATLWTGEMSIPEGEEVVVPVALSAGRVGALALSVANESLEYDPFIPVYWTTSALEQYFVKALQKERAAARGEAPAATHAAAPVATGAAGDQPGLALDPGGIPTQAELVAAVVRLLGLEAQARVTISADSATVAAPGERLDGIGPENPYYEEFIAALQAGILPAALVDGNRFEADAAATWGDALALLTRAREYITGRLGKPGERVGDRTGESAGVGATNPAAGNAARGAAGSGVGGAAILRPRSVEEYVTRAAALGWVDEGVGAGAPVTWSDLTRQVIAIFGDIPAVQLVRANPNGLRYVVTGTETYMPEQPYRSVGVFGLWSKGTDARAKGWLGNEHQRGLPAFTWQPSPYEHGLYWYRFHPDGSALLLGQIELAGEPVARSYQVHDQATAQWSITSDENGERVATEVYLSRAFPAVLYVTESPTLTWRVDDREMAFDKLFYLDVNGTPQTVALGRGPVELDPDRLGAPWILVDQELESTGEGAPILFRLGRRPSRIVARASAMLQLSFADGAGAVSIMPLYGIRRLTDHEANRPGWLGAAAKADEQTGPNPAAKAAETAGPGQATGADRSAWVAGLPAGALELIEFWSKALGAFPVGVDEAYVADEAAGYVWVTSAFRYHEVADDWGTEPLYVAPVPPVVALAEAAGYPVAWEQDVERSETATFLGPFAYSRGATVTYGLPIYASLEQVYTPVRVSGDERLESLQAEALRHVTDRWFRWPSLSLDSTLLGSHAVTYSLVQDNEARAWYKERIAQALAELYDERNLDTVIQPASGNSYIYSNRIWAAGEDFDREYYIGRQLVVTGQVAHWVGWDVVAPFWDVIRGLYAYYRIHWDWAWQGSTTFNTGFSYQADGVALSWEGMMSVARTALLAGDEALRHDALYRAAAVGASLYALWELTGWAMQNDYAVMHPGNSSQPVRRRPPAEILTGFLPDTFSEYTGIVTTMPTEWGASNWVHDELMGRTRFFNDYRFAELYRWQIHRVRELYPALSDGYNISSHLHTRSILYGRDPGLERAIAGVGIGTVQGSPGMSYHRVLLRSLVPQVWVSASTARVVDNHWDAAQNRLITELEVVKDGRVVYDWAWRSIDRIDPEAPAPDPGPVPGAVRVNGEPVAFETALGGWWRMEMPAAQGDRLVVEVEY